MALRRGAGPLTGLLNRKALFTRFAELREARQADVAVSLIVLRDRALRAVDAPSPGEALGELPLQPGKPGDSDAA